MYFAEVVVAHVLLEKVVALDVSHFERSRLNFVAEKNTNPKSMGTTDNATIG